MRIPTPLVLALFAATRCLAVPVSFEERDSRHFFARFGNGPVELRPDRVILRDVTLRFPGASKTARLEGIGRAAPSTYLRAGFARTFRQFPKLAIRNLYPGVDAVFYGSGECLEYDLKIKAGASLDRIRISVEGDRDVRIDEHGDLAIGTASGVVRQTRPRVFQGSREVRARYVALAAGEVGIRLGKHDGRLPLTIDPVLAYTRYFGQNGSNSASAIATDAQGNIYIAGQSNSANFPTTSSGFEPRSTPPLRVVSNAGATISPLPVAGEPNVGLVAGTPDGKILYAAAADGIFISGDSGATWRQDLPLQATGTTTASPAVNAISLDPLDPATALVATNVGLFGTDSGGQDGWGQRNQGLPVSGNGFVSVSSVFYSPVNPLVAYATTNSPSYLFMSADAGNTWQPLNPTYPGEPPVPTDPYRSIAATLTPDGSILYAIDGNGTLFRSADGGGTWTTLIGEAFFNPTAMKLDPTNSGTIYVLDQQGLHKSTDGGLTFASLMLPAMIQKFAIDSSGAVYVASFNGVYVSTDGGNTFTAIPSLASFGGINSLAALSGNVYVGSTSPSVPFVMKLDPTGSNILYSTFLGGSAGDGAAALAVDSQGNAVVVGAALSPDFPFTVPASNPPSPSKTDGFIAKLNGDGTHLIYAMALGGSKYTFMQAVALDASGAAYVTGQTASTDFPATAGAFQPAIPSTACTRTGFEPFIIVNSGAYAFASKIGADGSLAYSTFLAGSCGSAGGGIAVDAAGDAIVVGSTTSPDFPVSPNSYQPAYPGPVNPPTPPGVLDAGFATKLSPAGDKPIASTYLGGGYSTTANAVTLDAAGNVYLTGFTQGFALGATPGAYQTQFVDRCTPTISIGPSVPYTGTGDAFALKLDPSLSTAQFLTYLGGACNDSGSNIALDSAGNIWIGGTTASPDFPLKNPFQASNTYNSTPGFVAELSADASQLLFSSLSNGTALALGPAAVYLAGARGNSAFVTKIDPANTPAVEIASVSPVMLAAPPAATVEPFIPGIAPGQLIQIGGSNLGPASAVNAQLDASGHLPFVVDNTIVYFDGFPAPLISVGASSIECFAPFEISSSTEITVSSNGQRSNSVLLGVSPSAPQILAIANFDGTPNSADHPAQPGSLVALYVSGLGETNPPGDDGLVNAAPLPVPLVPVQVYLPAGAAPGVSPQYMSAAPGLIAGITQINVQVPTGIATTGGMAPIGIGSTTATLYVSQ